MRLFAGDFKEEKIDFAINWIHFSRSYLYSSELSCKEIVEKRYQQNEKYSRDFLSVAILYGIQHSIEIFLKSLKVCLKDKVDKSDQHHNTKELIEILQKALTDKNFKNNLSQQVGQEREGLEIFLDRMAEGLQKIINKYSSCFLIKKYLNDDFQIEDTDNTVFRYPFNTMKIRVNYATILNKITDDDINDILGDIKDLDRIFKIFGLLFLVFRKQDNL